MVKSSYFNYCTYILNNNIIQLFIIDDTLEENIFE